MTPRCSFWRRPSSCRADFAVETASDGVEGLEKLQTGRYDGIVLDVMMPRMDGYETAKQIKKLKDHRQHRLSW